MRYSVIVSLSFMLVGLAIMRHQALSQANQQDMPLPQESRLEPTLNWDNCPERGEEWQRMIEEGRIHVDAETGNYLIDYVASDGSQKSWLFEPANKLQVTVKANVSFDDATSLYTYSYTVINGAESAQRLWGFGVEHGEAEILNATAPPDDPSVPGKWLFFENFAERPVALWGDGEYKRHGIGPGGTIESGPSSPGFSLQSPQPPGVVRYYAQGYVPAPGPFARGEAPADPRPTFTATVS